LESRVECLLCHKWFRTLQFHLKKIHGMNGPEYKKLFPDSKIMCEKMREGTRLSRIELWHREDSPYKTQEYNQKKSLTMKRLWADPVSIFNDATYRKHKCEAAQRASPGISEKIKELWKDPNSVFNSPEYLKKISVAAKRMWADPDSVVNSPEFRKRLSDACSKVDRGYVAALWALPDSVYNSQEYLTKQSLRLMRTLGYGNRCSASDGHLCCSQYEFIFEEWLIFNNLKHFPHPKVPGVRRFADQLINGRYVEIDGMNRGKNYWDKKYKNTDVIPIVIEAKTLYSFNKKLNEDLFERLSKN